MYFNFNTLPLKNNFKTNIMKANKMIIKKSTALLIILLGYFISLFFNTDNLTGLIIKIQFPIYVIGYFIVKQLEENNTNN